MVNFKKIIFTLLCIFILNSCLEDILNPMIAKFDNASDLITYVETRTQLLKGTNYPVLVDVEEVHQNLNNYLLIDLRSPELFAAGHIPGAVNLDKSVLLEYLKNSDLTKFNKIVLVSNTGQIASYTACLMIIARYENICVLDRGMTYWHEFFSEEYENALGISKWWRSYNWHSSVKPSKKQVPAVEFSSNAKTIENKVEERIHVLLEKNNNSLFISASQFSDSYSPGQKWYLGYFPIYSDFNGINYSIRNNRTTVFGPNSSILYKPPWDFLAHRGLLTLRLDRNIVMQSPTGQISSFWQAYLLFLGYNKAVNLKYGSISIMGFRNYSIPIIDDEGNILRWVEVNHILTLYFFQKDLVRNYEYETGP